MKPPPFKKYTAIWDTGATHCAITKRVVSGLDLKPITFAQVETAGGSILRPVYLVCIGLPNKVAFSSIRVTEVELVGNADVLIGMDLITQGDFAVTHADGKTTLSYRIPSLACFDFVEEFKEASKAAEKFKDVGRNDLCPCGSGKKFKHCHMRDLKA